MSLRTEVEILRQASKNSNDRFYELLMVADIVTFDPTVDDYSVGDFCMDAFPPGTVEGTAHIYADPMGRIYMRGVK